MNKYLKEKIESLISKRESKEVKITKESFLSGGSINNTLLISTNIKKDFFLKYNDKTIKHFFYAEERGLLELRKQKAIQTPIVFFVFEKDKDSATLREDKEIPSFLLMEYIREGTKQKDFYEDFGRSLASLHKIKSDKYGFYIDNYIGANPQINTSYPSNSWSNFFREMRLSYQINLAKGRNLWDMELEKLWLSLEGKLTSILDKSTPSLLHGDLWSGNYIVGAKGKAVLIDPAVYYGSNETDLAMTELFGGFPRSFYSAYKEIIPIDKEYKDRKEIYNLYHLINHLNLFGLSYRSSVSSILKRFA